jgi:hypothetical protein
MRLLRKHAVTLRLALVLIVVFTFPSTIALAQDAAYGKFLDDLNVSLAGDGRKIVLLNNYRFQDPKGDIWLATKGSTVDGASIPRMFWSLIGGPLEGPYRNASVIHDYYCVTRNKDWQQTDRVFYQGMRAAGVSQAKALVMYYAVVAFGPRWGPQDLNTLVCTKVNGTVTCGIVTVNESERVDIPVTQEDLENVQTLERRLQAGERISEADLERMALDTGNPRFPRELRR